MIKKVGVEQIAPGMYVHDFNCSWLEHPFLQNSVLLKTDDDVKKVREFGVRELFIDTSKGADVADAMTLEEHKRESIEEMHRVFEPKRVGALNLVEYADELPKAKKVKQEAQKVITDIMADVKMGKQVVVEKAEHVVSTMVDSVFRNVDALTSLSRIKDADQYLFMHSVNVCVLIISFCRHTGIEREIINKVGVGALLHDVGKTKLPPAILNKPARLTEKEFEVMQKHPGLSRELLLETDRIPEEAIQVAYQHHERFDGTGYHERLKGDAVSQFGQMASVADVYDAITTDRVYHRGMGPAEAIRKIFEWSKNQFKEEIAHKFIKCVGIYPVGTLVLLDGGLLAVVSEPGRESMLSPVVRAVYDAKKRRHIKPVDIDLSSRVGSGEGEGIIGYEDPARHGINPLDYLDLHGIF